MKMGFRKFKSICAAPLYGLVLCGGRSARMGRAKAALRYHDEIQSHHCYSLLSSVCERTFVSIRATQRSHAAFRYLEQIHDAFPGKGPLNGLLSAMTSFPKAAWLVIACDMPFLNIPLLEELIAFRDPTKDATAFSIAECNFPEPLCSIYEPGILPALQKTARASRANGLRHVFMDADIHCISSVRSEELRNLNSYEEYRVAKQSFRRVA